MEKKVGHKTILVALIIAILVPFSPTIVAVAAEETQIIDKSFCAATIEDSFTDDEILVVITPSENSRDYTCDDFSEIGCVALEELTENVVEEKLCRIIKLTMPGHSKQGVLDAIKQLENRNDIYSAEPNYVWSVEATPNDNHYVSGNQWAINKIELPSAWNISTGTSTVYVGVIDTGINAYHPDLLNRVNSSLSRCFTSDYTTGLADAEGHGTHVAGIIGAQGNNAVGVVGTCWNIQLVSLRVVDSLGLIDVGAVISAIEYANTVGIKILNFSGGGSSSGTSAKSYEIAIRNYSGLMVCSAGNNSRNNDSIPHYPSHHNNLTNVISVGASTSADLRWESSNYGNQRVNIFAPGTNILSCYPIQMCSGGTCGSGHYAEGYHVMSGTSMATPYVAGVAALLLSECPDLTAAELKRKITKSNNVDSCNGVFDNLCVSNGRLNAYKVLSDAHTYAYTKKNAGHRGVCSCGKVVEENHTLVVSGSYLCCEKCDYKIMVSR